MILARHMISNGNGIGSQKGGSHMRQALHGAFLEVDGGLASNIDCEFSGCTCAVTHLQVRHAGKLQHAPIHTCWLLREAWQAASQAVVDLHPH
jgi:hypothetical protein